MKKRSSQIHRRCSLLAALLVSLFFTAPLAALELESTVIRADTTWSGEISIKGVVIVSRSAVLTIKPGTVVTFHKIDSDNDGVGDSEIRILGGLIAEGVVDNEIIFKSAEVHPAAKDWSYVLLFTSGYHNRIRYCRFMHGFSGLQVQFSTASVINSVFTDNHEGLRFGRADLSIENSLFASNDVGIRFTRMEGPALISKNEITGNRIGIFLVPSGQNITDFFAPDRSGVPWNTGRLKISGNNIYGNSWYNLSLGEKQFWDLEVNGNYWGSADAELIAESIFDQSRDPKLGRALYEPFLKKRSATGQTQTLKE